MNKKRLIIVNASISTRQVNKSDKSPPKRSTMMEFPSSRENPMSTHGRKGAWKFKRPKKFMRTFGFLLLHMYTSMMVKAWPKNTRFTNVPNICTAVKNITTGVWANVRGNACYTSWNLKVLICNILFLENWIFLVVSTWRLTWFYYT